MFVQDYSGFTRAAEIQAQGMQNLGATIGQGIKDFGEARQERKKIDAEIKATSAGIESAIKMGKDLGIDIGSYLSPIQAKINDPNTSPAEALALGRTAAQGISNAFTLGIGAQERSIASQRAQDENAFRLANLEVAQQRANIYGQKAQAEASKLTKGTLSFFDPDTNQSEEMDVNYDPQGRPRVIGTGELIVDPVKVKYGEGGVEKPPETSQVGGISDSIAKASQLNINQSPSDGVFGFTTKTRDELGRSSIGSRQVSLDFNAAASKDAKGIEIIIPNDATPEERNAANRYVQLTQKFFADRGLNRPIRGVRTAKENGRGTPGRFHTEPFFVGDGEARKIMESDPDGYAQVLANAFNGVQGVTFIAPHKKNDPGASDGKFNERDFAKGSIIPALERLSQGDPSPQMAGTPEQQAEVARQIKRGAGMQMVQAGGGMPTEPSLAQQQPQLPARRQVVATRPVGGGQQQQGTIMTQQQVNELEASGRQVSAVPTPDGNFRVTSVRTGTPQMGFEMTYDEQGRPILKQSATGVGATPKVGEGQILSTDASGRPSIVNIPGGKADIEAQKTAQAAENERKFELDRAGIVLSEIDKLIGYAGEMSRLPGASTYRKFTPMAGFEGASEVENTLDTVKAGFRFETLQRLKEASPTGSSGLGAVTKPEFDALAEEKGKLTQVGDPRELQRRATNYKKMVLDTIHGSKQDRDKLLKEGKITKESYDAVESLYPGFQKKQPLAPEVMEIRKRLLGE
jgi:hypothetical protein